MANNQVAIKELEYDKILNHQNLLLGFFGALALADFSSDIPVIIKISLLGCIIIGTLIAINIFSNNLNNKIRELSKLKS